MLKQIQATNAALLHISDQTMLHIQQLHHIQHVFHDVVDHLLIYIYILNMQVNAFGFEIVFVHEMGLCANVSALVVCPD